ncbi:MAG: HAMP domain-containing histidine kinase [Myxococcota bacterium]|nr:HAMP domain-containing histidine kinase [Myxococcota bacterium]
MPRESLTLRRTLWISAAASSALMLLLAFALVSLTSYQNQISQSLAASVESVVLAEEAEIDLLLLERAKDPVVREDLRLSLRRKLEAAEGFAASAEEKAAVRDARAAVEAYLKAGAPPGELENAFRFLERVVGINLGETQNARLQLDRSDALANLLGVASAVVFLVGLAALLLWLRQNILRPIFALAQAIESFHRGDRESRAPLQGPGELVEMAVRFNELASTVVRQREAQLTFLGGVAHDLRTPLGALRLALGRAVPREGPLPPEQKLRSVLALADRQVTRLERMVSDILDATQVEAGKLEVNLRPHDARELVQEVTGLLSGSADQERLRIQLPPGPVIIHCDPLRMEQVLNNLISNALKYSPDTAPVTVSLREENGTAVFAVRDEGIGLSPEDQARLFEPFQRLGLSKESIPGVGLGLFVVKRLVDAHQGTLRILSQPGHGSTFEVRVSRARG